MLLSVIPTPVIPFVTGVFLIINCVVVCITIGVAWTNSDSLIKLAKENEIEATMGVAGSFKE